jgi:hypothetical protein
MMPVARPLAGFERLATAGLLVLAAASFTSNAADNDLWGHLRYGRDFIRAGVPGTDPYSYTAAGKPWAEHEWGAEIVLARAWDTFGAPGLVLGKAALGTAAIALVLAAGRDGCPSAAALAAVTMPAVLGLFPWFGVRPQVFTNALFALTLWTLHRARRGRPRALWLLPLAMVAWTNLHGGYLAGLGVLALAAGVETARALRHGTPAPWPLLGAHAAASLATTATPFGPANPLFVLRSALLSRPDILEWRPLGAEAIRDFPTLAAVPLLLAVVAVSLAATRERRDPTELAILVVTGALAVRHVRHAPFLLLAAVWVLPRHLASAARAALPSWRTAFATAALVCGLASARLSYAVGAVDHLSVAAGSYPIGALRFMTSHDLLGNVAVDFNWGAYLVYHCHPRCRVSIDGRYEAAYPPAVYAMNRALAWGTPGWERLLVDYPTEVALLDARRPGAARVAETPGWTLVYRDPVAAVLVRDLPRFRDAIARFGRAPASFPLVDGVFP